MEILKETYQHYLKLNVQTWTSVNTLKLKINKLSTRNESTADEASLSNNFLYSDQLLTFLKLVCSMLLFLKLHIKINFEIKFKRKFTLSTIVHLEPLSFFLIQLAWPLCVLYSLKRKYL